MISIAIARNSATESSQVNASVDKGLVLITGKADSWAERNLASKVAKSIRGVRKVRNKVEVVFAKSRPDEEIKRDVRSGLVWDTLVDDELIFVAVSVAGEWLHTSAAARYCLRRREHHEDFFATGISNLPCPKAYDQRAFVP